MFSSEVDVLIWHSLSNRFYIMCSVCHANLKVAVAAVAGEIVIAPVSGQETERRACRRVAWQPRIVWFEEILKPLITSFALQSVK